ncbi:hypothetical protein CEE37_05410 [candidate division LCP-89 bacterium B3_LCP]|uniref:Uncharacterized protein n=1 Tax=candidate division LCP-89 bacterium B3_LCP TaxID=2012998 RepID=A0A532V1L0_UNCL8|nr:MAG: hypothetical protein CEE37_05410 [candidate division LCP-89 bacterium B3_LCP]
MAVDKALHPKGSIIFKLLIVVFLFLMMVSILFPRAEWKVQDEEKITCQLQMENLSYVVREYSYKHQGYVDSLGEYLEFIRTDSVLVDPPRYEIESLVRDASEGRDSLLLDFSDEFHLSHFKADTIRRVVMEWVFLLLDSIHVYVVREHGLKNQGYVDDLGEYLEFIRTDSVLIDQARYEIERLTRDASEGRDSLLLDFSDEFHLSHFKADTTRLVVMERDSLLLDSVHVYVVPHREFIKIPVSILVLTAETPITVMAREKNVTDHAMLIWANSHINYSWIMPEPVLMKASDAVISLPVDSLELCTTSRMPYKLNVNVRSRLEGVAKFLVHKDSLETNISRDTLMVDLFNHNLKTDALAEVLVIVAEDSSLIEKKDSLLVSHFIKKVSEVKRKDEFEVSGDYTITVPADTMANWQDSLRIRQAVFLAHVDSLSMVLKSLEEFQLLTTRVSYEESYYIAKVDTIGVTIRCPIDSVYHKPDRSLIQKIFGVGPTENHGHVENGDLSWSEQK